jgi:hypothetical protein
MFVETIEAESHQARSDYLSVDLKIAVEQHLVTKTDISTCNWG